MQLDFLCLLTMLIPFCKSKIAKSKVLSTDQLGSRLRSEARRPCVKSAARPPRLSKTYALLMDTAGLNAIAQFLPPLLAIFWAGRSRTGQTGTGMERPLPSSGIITKPAETTTPLEKCGGERARTASHCPIESTTLGGAEFVVEAILEDGSRAGIGDQKKLKADILPQGVSLSNPKHSRFSVQYRRYRCPQNVILPADLCRNFCWRIKCESARLNRRTGASLA